MRNANASAETHLLATYVLAYTHKYRESKNYIEKGLASIEKAYRSLFRRTVSLSVILTLVYIHICQYIFSLESKQFFNYGFHDKTFMI